MSPHIDLFDFSTNNNSGFKKQSTQSATLYSRWGTRKLINPNIAIGTANQANPNLRQSLNVMSGFSLINGKESESSLIKEEDPLTSTSNRVATKKVLKESSITGPEDNISTTYSEFSNAHVMTKFKNR